MRLEKIPLPKDTMCVMVISDNTNHMVYCLDEQADVIESIHIKDASLTEVVSLIKHMVILVLEPRTVFDMICGYKLRAGHIFEPDFYPYNHMAWRYFLDVEKLLIVREFAKLKNVLNYEYSEEYEQKKNRITDYIFSRPTPIEQTDETVHQKMIEARKYELGALQNWVVSC